MIGCFEGGRVSRGLEKLDFSEQEGGGRVGGLELANRMVFNCAALLHATTIAPCMAITISKEEKWCSPIDRCVTSITSDDNLFEYYVLK